MDPEARDPLVELAAVRALTDRGRSYTNARDAVAVLAAAELLADQLPEGVDTTLPWSAVW